MLDNFHAENFTKEQLADLDDVRLGSRFLFDMATATLEELEEMQP